MRGSSPRMTKELRAGYYDLSSRRLAIHVSPSAGNGAGHGCASAGTSSRGPLATRKDVDRHTHGLNLHALPILADIV